MEVLSEEVVLYSEVETEVGLEEVETAVGLDQVEAAVGLNRAEEEHLPLKMYYRHKKSILL